MITEEERKLMEQIEQLEPKVFIDIYKLTNEQAAQYIKDRDELVKIRNELNRTSNFKYRHVGVGPGSAWIQYTDQRIYQAVHECGACEAMNVVSFLTKEERDWYIEAEATNSKISYTSQDIEVTQVIRRTP